jgi:hypothetical protein
LERIARYFAKAVADGALRPCNPREAADTFLDLTAGNLHSQRLWNVIQRPEGAALDAETRRITAVFLAAYGNEELCRTARENDRP